MKQYLFVWSSIMAFPLVPVIILYIIFDQQNYFQLQGIWRNVLAAGPIGAYIFVYWHGWIVFEKLGRVRKIPVAILGEWYFETNITGSNDKNLHGRVVISNLHGELQLRGEYMRGDAFIGSIHSKFACWRSGHLYYSYVLTITDEDEPQVVEGVCETTHNITRRTLQGNWARLHSNISGQIKMQQVISERNKISKENARVKLRYNAVSKGKLPNSI